MLKDLNMLTFVVVQQITEICGEDVPLEIREFLHRITKPAYQPCTRSTARLNKPFSPETFCVVLLPSLL